MGATNDVINDVIRAMFWTGVEVFWRSRKAMHVSAFILCMLQNGCLGQKNTISQAL